MVPSPILTILVLGSGELGQAVLESLAARPEPHSLAVMVRPSTLEAYQQNRDSKKSHDILTYLTKTLNVSLVPGDVAAWKSSELAAIFANYDVVVGCNGMGLPTGSQLRILEGVILAAKEKQKGGQRLRYFPWQWGLDYDVIGKGSSQDLFDEQIAVRDRLRSQETKNAGLQWTIVQVGLFASFFFVPEFGVVDLEQKTVRGLGGWENKVTATTPDDIGRMAAELVFVPPRPKAEGGRGWDEHEDTSGLVFVAGDTVTYGRVAELVEAKWPEKEWKKEEWGPEVLARRIKEMPDDVMVKYQTVFGAGVGTSWDLEKTVNYKRGIKLQDVESYIQGLDLV